MKSSHRATKPLRAAQTPIVNVIFFIGGIVPVKGTFSKHAAKWISLRDASIQLGRRKIWAALASFYFIAA